MAQKLYNTEKAAEVLGVSVDEVKAMRERRQLVGYRDGPDWKYKVEDVEKLAAEAKKEGGGEDVLLSDKQSSISDTDDSGTVIGGPEESDQVVGSDVQIAGSDIEIAGSDIQLVGSDVPLSDSDLKRKAAADSPEEDVDLAPVDAIASEETAAQTDEPAETEKTSGDSAVSLADDDLVLGGSGSGSDITIGGDSGIQLVDAADSGLSLDEPVDLVGEEESESLELGEDDLLSIDDSNLQQQGMGDEGDFLLTPMEDVGDAEDSESGSQVIALEEEAGDEDATMIGSMSDVSGPPMLDEDVAMDAMGVGSGPQLEPAPMMPAQDYAAGAAVGPAAVAPEAPYTTANIISSAACAFLLALGGMMTFDLLRNMWSWQEPFTLNSWIMDSIVNLFG